MSGEGPRASMGFKEVEQEPERIDADIVRGHERAAAEAKMEAKLEKRQFCKILVRRAEEQEASQVAHYKREEASYREQLDDSTKSAEQKLLVHRTEDMAYMRGEMEAGFAARDRVAEDRARLAEDRAAELAASREACRSWEVEAARSRAQEEEEAYMRNHLRSTVSSLEQASESKEQRFRAELREAVRQEQHTMKSEARQHMDQLKQHEAEAYSAELAHARHEFERAELRKFKATRHRAAECEEEAVVSCRVAQRAEEEVVHMLEMCKKAAMLEHQARDLHVQAAAALDHATSLRSGLEVEEAELVAMQSETRYLWEDALNPAKVRARAREAVEDGIPAASSGLPCACGTPFADDHALFCSACGMRRHGGQGQRENLSNAAESPRRTTRSLRRQGTARSAKVDARSDDGTTTFASTFASTIDSGTSPRLSSPGGARRSPPRAARVPNATELSFAELDRAFADWQPTGEPAEHTHGLALHLPLASPASPVSSAFSPNSRIMSPPAKALKSWKLTAEKVAGLHRVAKAVAPKSKGG